MKSIVNRLSLIFVFLFVAAMVFSAYYLYIFPDRLNRGSVLVDQETIKNLSPVFTELNIVVFSGLVLGLITLMLQLFNNSGKDEDMVYTEINHVQNEEEGQQEVSINQEEEKQKFSIKEYEKILQEKGELKKIFNKVLWTACKELEASQATLYRSIEEEDKRFIELLATFAYSVPDSELIKFEYGEGLAGQVAKEGRVFNITDVPEGYLKVVSGLGSSSPSHLMILPIADNDNIVGVMEIASFKPFDKHIEKFLEKLSARLAERLLNHNTEKSVKEEQQN